MYAASVQNEVRVTRQPLVEDDATPFGGGPRKDVQVGDVCNAHHKDLILAHSGAMPSVGHSQASSFLGPR